MRKVIFALLITVMCSHVALTAADKSATDPKKIIDAVVKSLRTNDLPKLYSSLPESLQQKLTSDWEAQKNNPALAEAGSQELDACSPTFVHLMRLITPCK